MSTSIAIVIGTRPEAIKLAPVAEALARRGIKLRLIFTGQHPLTPDDFGLTGYPAVGLDCIGQPDPCRHVEMVANAVSTAIAGCTLVVVQGDTSSALGGALAAARQQVPLAHVEAGLRSHDRQFPWPEEDFRRQVDAIACLLFAPTELSAANLRREQVRGSIIVTGNTGIDAVLRWRRENAVNTRCQGGVPRLLVTCHRRESWGAGLQSIASALRSIATLGLAEVDVLLHPNPATATQVRSSLSFTSQIHLCAPLPHWEALDRIASSDLVLSDSGGIQEECAALGVPILVLRKCTERPEGIACGTMRLVGTDPERIVKTVAQALAGPARSRSHLPYGDGGAADRIATATQDWLESAIGRAFREAS